MRLTIDRDSTSVFDFFLTIIKGLIYVKRLPDEIKKSAGGRGYHYVYKGAAKDWLECVELRRVVGDDKNRLKHDLKKSDGFFKQVLFDRKSIIYYDK